MANDDGLTETERREREVARWATCPHNDKVRSTESVQVDVWGRMTPWICRACGMPSGDFVPRVDDYTREMVKRGMAGAALRWPMGVVEAILAAHQQ